MGCGLAFSNKLIPVDGVVLNKDLKSKSSSLQPRVDYNRKLAYPQEPASLSLFHIYYTLIRSLLGHPLVLDKEGLASNPSSLG